MYDKSYCATECEDSSCERNIKFNKPNDYKPVTLNYLLKGGVK